MRHRLLALLAVLMLVPAACGSADDNVAEADSSTVDTTTTEQSNTAEECVSNWAVITAATNTVPCLHLPSSNDRTNQLKDAKTHLKV